MGLGLRPRLGSGLGLGSAWSASICAVTPVAISSSLIDRLAHCLGLGVGVRVGVGVGVGVRVGVRARVRVRVGV